MSEQTSLHEHSPSVFVDLALSRIPSAFGRLAFVAGLRQTNPDHYDDPLAVLVYGKDQIDAVLRRNHYEIFSAWLSVDLATQTEEVAEYLAVQADGQYSRMAHTLKRWIQYNLYVNLIPEAASAPEGEMFSSDLRAILNLLQVRLNAEEAEGV